MKLWGLIVIGIFYAAIAAAAQNEIVFDKNGKLSLGDTRLGMTLYTSKWHPVTQEKWSNCKETDFPWGKQVVGVAEVDGNKAEIVQKFYKKERGFSCTWTIAFEKETQLNALFAGFTLPLPFRRVIVDGKEIQLPENCQKLNPYSVKNAKRISFEYRPGGYLTLSSPDGMNFAVQDERHFYQKHFTLRFYFSPAHGKIKTAHLELNASQTETKSFPLDIRENMNRGFADSPELPCRGWTAQGPDNDLHTIKAGRLKQGALEFQIIDPTANNGRGTIVLAGERRDASLPKKTKILCPDDSKAKAVALLHASAWPGLNGTLLGKIRVKYQDNMEEEFPVRIASDLGNWWGCEPLPNGAVAWEGENPQGKIGLYASVFPLKKESPASIELEITDRNSMWMIPAVSLLSRPVHFRIPERKTIVRQADETWIPMEFRNQVVPGSPLDFSFLADAPAGKYGRVKASPKGTLCFANNPEKRLKLFGVNLCFGANRMKKEFADSFAEGLVRRGYNAVRFHHADGGMSERIHSKLSLKADALDRMDYLLAALKKRGIYVTIDFYTSREIKEEKITPSLFKAMIPVSAERMDDWKDYVRLWLNHRNPYTGMTWGEDPAIVCANLVNEDYIVKYWNMNRKTEELYRSLFNDWKKKNGYWNAEASDKDPRFIQFLQELQQKEYSEMKRFVREELKSELLLTSSNFENTPLQAELRSGLDLVDNHLYHDHPSFVKKAWSFPKKYHQQPAIARFARLPGLMMPTRIFGLPFLVTEYNYCYPNEYRSEAGPLIGSYAALQDWDGLFRFAWSHDHRSIYQVRAMHGFDIVGDPISQLTDRITAVMFLRGDVRAADTKIAEAVQPQNFSHEFRNYFSQDFIKLGLIAQIGTVWNTRNNDVDYFLTDAAGSPENIPEKTVVEKWETVLRKGVAVSETNEIVLDSRFPQSLIVASPYSESITANSGRGGKGMFLKADRLSCFQTISILSLDGKKLEHSDSLLLLHLTNKNNSKMKMSQDGKIIYEQGSLPYLLQRGNAEISLNSRYDFQIRALNADGKVQGLVKGFIKNGRFCFKADTGMFRGGTLAYHLKRQKK